jgi:hypothetical protein
LGAAPALAAASDRKVRLSTDGDDICIDLICARF